MFDVLIHVSFLKEHEQTWIFADFKRMYAILTILCACMILIWVRLCWCPLYYMYLCLKICRKCLFSSLGPIWQHFQRYRASVFGWLAELKGVQKIKDHGKIYIDPYLDQISAFLGPIWHLVYPLSVCWLRMHSDLGPSF